MSTRTICRWPGCNVNMGGVTMKASVASRSSLPPLSRFHRKRSTCSCAGASPVFWTSSEAARRAAGSSMRIGAMLNDPALVAALKRQAASARKLRNINIGRSR